MTPAAPAPTITSFDPASFTSFRFLGRSLDWPVLATEARISLRYALDDLEFEETFVLPLPAAPVLRGEKCTPTVHFSPREAVEPLEGRVEAVEGRVEPLEGRVEAVGGRVEPLEGRVEAVGGRVEAVGGRVEPLEGLLDLLHWVVGVSYYKAAIPPTVSFEHNAPGPAARALLSALYSEGLGELAVVNRLPGLPSPQFGRGSISMRPPHGNRPASQVAAADGARGSKSMRPPHGNRPARASADGLRRLLVPVGGGKDSAVAIEIARQSGLDVTLFSVGDATPIRETARVSGYQRLVATRKIDPLLLEANRAGALNGHVPITAIVSCVALLSAALNGQDAVTLANERSASAGNMIWHGTEINHQFSKSLRAERLLKEAVAEVPDAPQIFSVLRPASELSVARAFATMSQYHPVFTSCNRVFKLDPAQRASAWCCDCDKCRFVYLVLAPFATPAQLTAIFGHDLLDDAAQYDGFALLTATGGEKPFECVGEVDECLAAIRLLSESPAWGNHAVVKRLVAEVLTARPVSAADLDRHFALSDEHEIPEQLLGAVREVLGA